MSLENLHPFSGQHAIESAAFALEFSSDLDVGEVGALRTAAAQLLSDFPVIAEKQVATLNFQVAPGGAATSSSSGVEAGGFTLGRTSFNPTEPQVRFIDVSRNGIVVVVRDYTRWDKFKADVDRYLSILLAPVDGQKAVSSLGLQFNDIFLWKADPQDLKIDEIFSRNNPFIASNSFSSSMLWHSHHGYLISNTEPVQHKQLDNINVSRAASNELHQIQVLTSHRVTLDKPLFKSWSAHKATFFEFQEKLHSQNKLILSQLLTPAVQSKINLNGSKEF